MIYLDTHVVVWLYAGLIDRLSNTAHRLITAHAGLDNDLLLSKDANILRHYTPCPMGVMAWRSLFRTSHSPGVLPFLVRVKIPATVVR